MKASPLDNASRRAIISATLLAAGLSLGGIVALSPWVAAVGTVLVALVMLFFVVPLSVWLSGLMLVCLAVPVDYIGSTATVMRGLPSAVFLVAGLLMALSSDARSRVRALRITWEMLLLSAWLFVAVLLSGDLGGMREVVMWASGAVLVWGLASRVSEDSSALLRALGVSFMLVGAFMGLAAIAERYVGGAGVYSILAGYQPIVRDVGGSIGVRASSFAGHPLRLGTLEMLAVVSCVSGLASSSRSMQVCALLCLPVSSAGLVLSGARGAWLASAVGIAVYLALSWRGKRQVAMVVTLAVSLTLVLTAASTPVGKYMLERISGSASQSTSIGQRLAVGAVAGRVIAERPVFGWGFRGSDSAVQAQGLRLANVENDYLGLAIAAGIPAVLLLIFGVVRSTLAILRVRTHGAAPYLGALIAALAVNIGTYNMLTWSYGPAVLMLLLLLARRVVACEPRSL